MADSAATFYNWAIGLVIFSLVVVSAGQFAKDMADPYSNFTTNQSPLHYTQNLTGLSTIEETKYNSSKFLDALSNTEEPEDFTLFGIPIPGSKYIVELSTFGILIFNEIGNVITDTFKMLSQVPQIIAGLLTIIPGLGGAEAIIVTGIRLIAVIAIIFMLIRVVLKRDNP